MSAPPRLRSLLAQTSLLNCARPDIQPGAMLSTFLIGLLIPVVTTVLSASSDEPEFARYALATGLWLVLPYAVFQAAGRIDRGAKILFAGGEPVLLALGFHDRRLAIGLVGGVVLFAAAAYVGAAPVAVLLGAMLFVPFAKSLLVIGVFTTLAISQAMALATLRLGGDRVSKRSKWISRSVSLAIVAVLTLFEVARSPGLTLDFLSIVSVAASSLWRLVTGFYGFSLAYDYTQDSVRSTSVLYPLLYAGLSLVNSIKTLSAIPEGQDHDTALEAAADAMPAAGSEAFDDGDETVPTAAAPAAEAAAAAVTAPPRRRPAEEFVAEIEPDEPRRSDLSTAPNQSVAAAVGVVRPTRTAPVAAEPVSDRSVSGGLRRRSVRWPDGDLFAEWDRRIMPWFRPVIYLTLLGGLLLGSLMVTIGLGHRRIVIRDTCIVLASLGVPTTIAIVLYSAYRIPRELLSTQLSGGSEALVMANITPQKLISRAIRRTTLIGLTAVALASVPVAAWLLRSNHEDRVFLALAIAYSFLATLAVQTVSVVTTLRGTGDFARVLSVLLALFLPPVALLVFVPLLLRESRTFGVSQRPIFE